MTQPESRGSDPTDRTTHVLSPDECWHLLQGAHGGHLTYVQDVLPVIWPVTFTTSGRYVMVEIESQPWLVDAEGQVVAVHTDQLTDAGYGWSVTLVGIARRRNVSEFGTSSVLAVTARSGYLTGCRIDAVGWSRRKTSGGAEMPIEGT